MSDLFADAAAKRLESLAPLAYRLRPRTLEEFVGQEQVLGPDSALRKAIVTSCVAVGLFAWMLHRHVSIIDSDHLFAFAIGVSIPYLRRTVSSRTNVAAIKRATD